MSGAHTIQRLIPVLGLLVALGAFLADLFLPLGAAAGACYVLAVLTTFGYPSRRLTLGMAVVVSAMLLTTWFVSDASLVWTVVLNVLLTLATIWSAALFLFLSSRVVVRLRHVEAESQSRKAWLAQTLASIGDGVIATDGAGHIEFMNKVAESLTGWSEAEAVGQPVEKIFDVRNEATGEPMPNPIRDALSSDSIGGLEAPAILVCQDGTDWPIDDSAAPIRDDAGRVVGAVMVFRDISERRKQEHQMELRLREAGHRIRNVFTNVRSILSLCQRATSTPEDLVRCFDTRMASLVRSTDRLLRADGSKSSLRDIIIDEVGPYLENEHDRLHISGEDIFIGPKASVSLAMILHELATNASKHGSLSGKDGKIEIDCRSAMPDTIELVWSEVAQRRVKDPETPLQAGLGTTLIAGLVRTQFAGTWDPLYGDDGFSCRLNLSLPPEQQQEAEGVA